MTFQEYKTKHRRQTRSLVKRFLQERPDLAGELVMARRAGENVAALRDYCIEEHGMSHEVSYASFWAALDELARRN